jgi:hypothetical protein
VFGVANWRQSAEEPSIIATRRSTYPGKASSILAKGAFSRGDITNKISIVYIFHHCKLNVC